MFARPGSVMELAKLHINLEIGNQRIPLNVNSEDELLYRKAAKLLNDKFNLYVKRFPKLSLEQLWIYVSLDVAVNLHSDVRDKNIEPYVVAIQTINQKIENALNE